MSAGDRQADVITTGQGGIAVAWLGHASWGSYPIHVVMSLVFVS